jgi:hypothetical protein
VDVRDRLQAEDVTRQAKRADEERAAEIAYRRDIRRGRIVIAGALALAGALVALVVLITHPIDRCAFAVVDPALKGKSYVCPDTSRVPVPEAG